MDFSINQAVVAVVEETQMLLINAKNQFMTLDGKFVNDVRQAAVFLPGQALTLMRIAPVFAVAVSFSPGVGKRAVAA